MRQKDLSFDISLKTKDLVHFHSGRGLFSFPFDLEKRTFLPFFLLFGVKSLLFSIFSSFLFCFLSFFYSLWGKGKWRKRRIEIFAPERIKGKCGDIIVPALFSPLPEAKSFKVSFFFPINKLKNENFLFSSLFSLVE